MQKGSTEFPWLPKSDTQDSETFLINSNCPCCLTVNSIVFNFWSIWKTFYLNLPVIVVMTILMAFKYFFYKHYVDRWYIHLHFSLLWVLLELYMVKMLSRRYTIMLRLSIFIILSEITAFLIPNWLTIQHKILFVSERDQLSSIFKSFSPSSIP